jgi:hypothetical protein
MCRLERLIMNLDDILERLERHRQRATYGAVAGIVGGNPQSPFIGRPFTPRNSWVVNTDTDQPTGYDPSQLHPNLSDNPHVIRRTEELRTWLTTHP